MVRFNQDIFFIDTSGQIRVRDGDLTLRADESGNNDIIVSGASLRPEADCVSDKAVDLGRDFLRWKTLYACSGQFRDRPSVSGSGIALQNELGVTAAFTFAVSDGTDFVINHGLGTELFTWALFRTDVTPNIAFLPRNIAPVDENNIRIQLGTPVDGRLVITTQGGGIPIIVTSGGGAGSGTGGSIALGQIDSNGNANSIAGATVVRVSVGLYRVTFDTPQADNTYPILVTPEQNAGTDDYFFAYTNVTTTSFDVEIREQDDGGGGGTLVDSGFSFEVPDINSVSGGSGVISLNGLTGGLNFNSLNDGIAITESSPNIELEALFTSASGALVDQALSQGSSIIQIAEYYLSTNTGSFTTALTTLVPDTDVIQDSYYSRSAGVITINTSGIYKVSYSVNIDQTAGNSRSSVRGQVTLNGSTAISQSTSWIYSRNNAQGEGTLSKTFFVSLNSSDNIRFQAQRDSGAGTFTYLAGSNISIEFVRLS